MNALKRFAMVEYIGRDVKGDLDTLALFAGFIFKVMGFTRNDEGVFCVYGEDYPGFHLPLIPVVDIRVLSAVEVAEYEAYQDDCAAADYESEMAVNRSLGVNVL